MKKFLNYLPLVSIIVFGYFLRVININFLPATLNPDEAALGYNAFSILKTGADEHGVFLPLAMQSFGDWKLPVYSYLDAISLALFGISKFSVRLPSILSGTIAIFLLYLISYKLFKNKTLGLLTALFVAINPWSVFFSRGAYEVNVATTIFLGGFLFLLIFLETRKIRWLVFTFALSGITMFTQHNYIVFAPMYLFTLLVLLWKKYTINLNFLGAAIFFIVLSGAAVISLVNGGGQKVSNLSIFNDPNVVYSRADKLRGDSSGGNKALEKILYNKYSAGVYQLTFNYLNAYSPDVLLDKGGERLTHNLGDIGYFYVADALFFLTGIFFLIWKKEKFPLLVLLPWLIFATLPSAVTREHTGTRLFTIVPPFLLVCSFGVYSFIQILRLKFLKLAGIVSISVLVLISFTYFADYYFVHFNTQRMAFWSYGYEDAVKLSQKYPDYNVVMRGPENFPYIYFLLYNTYDPKTFRKQVVYYPETKNGFLYVKSFGKYEFVNKIDYNKLSSKTIYFDDVNKSNGFPGITLPNGDVVMKYLIHP